MKPGLTFGLLLAVASTTCYALPSPTPVRVVEAGGLELTLVHVNDMHARYEQTSAFSGACSERDAQAGACYGGHARVATVIKQTRQQEPNVLVLNAGDTYQGTVYYSVFKWNISAEFVNLLNFDAITLGNHEFDDHTEGLVPFVERINKNLVLANADFSGEPKLAALNIKKSIIVERAGVKIGIIGYLTPETAFLASVDNVSFSDEVIAVKAEAAELKKKGVDIIIGLGHSGYERDKTIAAEVPDIDLVVGGHSHTFLYSGTPPDSDVPMGLYPTWITQPSGRKVPVLQAYAFTKYIGRLKLKFDDNGELISLQGGPILLNKDVAEDPETLAAVGLWKRDLDSQIEQALGITRVFLDGASCRRQECNLGNLVADAFIYGRAEFLRLNTQWTDASVALVNGGSIRTSINATSSGGIIKIRDAMETMPFDNLQVLLKIKGSVLLEALEHSVSEYVPGSAWKGSFLQVSGVRVIYDVSKPSGQRVVSVSVRCDVCTIPAYSPLDKDTVYGVIVNGFLANGGDGFTMFANNEGSVVLQDTDGGTLQHYIQKRGVVYPGLEGRIAFQSGDGPPSPTPSATSTSTSPTTTTRSSTQLPSSTTPASPSSRPTAAVPAWVLLLASLLLATLAR